MPSIEFEVWCGTCGAGLCSLTAPARNGISVEACPTCMEKAKDDGDTEGYQRGYEEGHRDAEAENAEQGGEG